MTLQKSNTEKAYIKPTVLGKGYSSLGKYKKSENGKSTKDYVVWSSMLRRCYSEIYLNRNPSYGECSVYDEWLDFQNFAEWFENNYVEGYHLDKDILIQGNKIYSPDTCCFVPSTINSLFTMNKLNKGLYPVGVHKQDEKFISYSSFKGYKKYLGSYHTPEEAFEAYKIYKENLIKSISYSQFCANKITEKVYKALLLYKI